MIVFDTNILSEVMKDKPEPAVVDWLGNIAVEHMLTTAISQAEILYGVRRLPEGARRTRLVMAAHDLFTRTFAGRILPFDDKAASMLADIRISREPGWRTDLPRGRHDRRHRHEQRCMRRNTRQARLRGLWNHGRRPVGSKRRLM